MDVVQLTKDRPTDAQMFGTSEMAARVTQFNWASTPLGPISGWPMSLRVAVGICLNSRFPMFVWWGPQRINIYNDAYVPILGQRHPNALGKQACDVWNEIWPTLGPQVEAVDRGDSTWNERVLLVIERNGYVEDTYFNWSYSPIPGDDGGIGGLFCVCTEETVRVIAERERGRMAEQHQLALDAASMGWWHYDPITKISSYDARYRKIFDVTGEQQPNAEIMARLHPDDVPGVWQKVEAALDPINPQAYAAEYRIYRTDGSIRWIDAHGIVTFAGEGAERHAVSFVGTVADITDRKAAETRREENERRLRTIEERLAFAIEAAELGTFYCPMPMGKILWNAKCKEHFWLGPDAEVDFDTFYSILHPDDRECTRQAVEDSIFSKKPYDIQYRTLASDGRTRWVRAKGRAYYGNDGQPTRFDGVTLDITEQKRVEAELRESETRFRQLADAMPQLVWTAGPTGGVEYYNTQWYAYTNLPNGDTSDAGWRSVIHADDAQLASSEFQKCIRDQSPYQIEFRLRRGSDQAYRWFLSRAQPILDAGGHIVRWFGTNTDIDDLKRLEHERERLLLLLENERAKLAKIVEHAPAFICTLRGAEHTFELANDHYYQLVGRRELIGKSVREALPEVVEQGFIELLDHVYSTGQSFVGDQVNVQIRRDSSDRLETRFVNFVYQAMRDIEGKVSGIFVHGVDVTDMVHSHDAVRKSEARYRELSDAMPQIVWTATADGVFETYNRQWFEYIGVTADEPDQPKIDFYLHDDERNQVEEKWADAVRTGNSLMLECRIRRHDGVYRWFLVRAVPTRDERGYVSRWLGTCTDIDQLRELQELNRDLLVSERAARAEAERSSRLKDEFLSTVSHELRTPLNAILGYSQLMQSEAGLSADTTQGLEVIERNARSQAQIIEDILEMSRIASGKLTLEIAPMDLHAVIVSAVETVQPAADARGVHIICSFGGGVPTINGDAGRIQQIIWNLLSNAIKFTDKGGAVKVRTAERDVGIEISVVDTGKGIDREFLPFVFDKFRQADATTARRHGGLGLGLAIVKNLVELHGGAIRVNSPGAGKGSTFTFTLPVVMNDRDPQQPKPLRGTQVKHLIARPRIALKDVRVLVVDDEPDAREIARRFLEDAGAIVTTAGSASEARAALGRSPVDVLLSDIGMPDEDGYSLIRGIRSSAGTKHANVPAAALTAFARSEDRQRALSAGFQAHLCKPLEPAFLLQTVADLARQGTTSP